MRGTDLQDNLLVRDKPKHSDNKIQNKSWHQSYISGLVKYLEVHPCYVYHKVNWMFSSMVFENMCFLFLKKM